jgi:hypothetical protein
MGASSQRGATSLNLALLVLVFIAVTNVVEKSLLSSEAYNYASLTRTSTIMAILLVVAALRAVTASSWSTADPHLLRGLISLVTAKTIVEISTSTYAGSARHLGYKYYGPVFVIWLVLYSGAMYRAHRKTMRTNTNGD